MAIPVVNAPWISCQHRVPRPCFPTRHAPQTDWKTTAAAATLGGTLAALLQRLRRAVPPERRRLLREASLAQLRIIAVGLELPQCADEQRLAKRISQAFEEDDSFARQRLGATLLNSPILESKSEEFQRLIAERFKWRELQRLPGKFQFAFICFQSNARYLKN